MEEVDRIIIHSLRDIGCQIDDETEILDKFTTNLVIEAASKCLEMITPGTDLPKALPQNMAARFHVGATIAEAVKALGYNGEIGYQTFLYSNVVEVRRVFMFLIEKLPRETEKSFSQPDDHLSNLKKNITLSIRDSFDKRYQAEETSSLAFISTHLETGISMPGTSKDMSPQARKEYCLKLPFITEQTNAEQTLCSIAVLNDCSEFKSVAKPKINIINVPLPSTPVPAKRTWLSMRENLLYEKEVSSPIVTEKVPVVSEENNENKEEREKIEIQQLKENIEKLKFSVKISHASLAQLKEEFLMEEAKQESSKEIEAHRKALELLPKHEDNLKKLDEIATIAQNRLLTLASQWETHRKALIEKYRAAKSSSSKASETDKIETITDLKAKLDSLYQQIAKKQKIRAKLMEEYEQLPKNIKRSAYTRRIMEIINNIKKQNDEIEKILKDTKTLQKDINTMSEKLERLFIVADETIYRNVKKDEISKTAYKHLTTLHNDCADIVKMVKETGSIVREIRDIEEQIEIESGKNVGANLERISADLQQMKNENKSLKNQQLLENSS